MKYIAVAPQIVGNSLLYGYSFSFDDEYSTSVTKARENGIRNFGHDDFFIAEFRGERCVAVWIGEDGVGRRTSKDRDFGEYVKGINKELGV